MLVVYAHLYVGIYKSCPRCAETKEVLYSREMKSEREGGYNMSGFHVYRPTTYASEKKKKVQVKV